MKYSWSMSVDRNSLSFFSSIKHFFLNSTLDRLEYEYFFMSARWLGPMKTMHSALMRAQELCYNLKDYINLYSKVSRYYQFEYLVVWLKPGLCFTKKIEGEILILWSSLPSLKLREKLVELFSNSDVVLPVLPNHAGGGSGAAVPWAPGARGQVEGQESSTAACLRTLVIMATVTMWGDNERKNLTAVLYLPIQLPS